MYLSIQTPHSPKPKLHKNAESSTMFSHQSLLHNASQGHLIPKEAADSFIGYAIVHFADVKFEWQQCIGSFTDQRPLDKVHVDSLVSKFRSSCSRLLPQNAIRVTISRHTLTNHLRDKGLPSPMQDIAADLTDNANVPTYYDTGMKGWWVVEAGQHRMHALKQFLREYQDPTSQEMLSEDEQAKNCWWLAEIYDSDTLTSILYARIRRNLSMTMKEETAGREYLQCAKVLATTTDNALRKQYMIWLAGSTEGNSIQATSVSRLHRLISSAEFNPILINLLDFPAYSDTFKVSQFDEMLVLKPTALSFIRWRWYPQTILNQQVQFWDNVVGISNSDRHGLKPVGHSVGDWETIQRKSDLRLRNCVTTSFAKALGELSPRTAENIRRLLQVDEGNPSLQSSAHNNKCASRHPSFCSQMTHAERENLITRTSNHDNCNIVIISSMTKIPGLVKGCIRFSSNAWLHVLTWLCEDPAQAENGTVEVILDRLMGSDEGKLRVKKPQKGLSDFYDVFRILIERLYNEHNPHDWSPKALKVAREEYQTRFSNGKSGAWLDLACIVYEWFDIGDGITPFRNDLMMGWVPPEHRSESHIVMECLFTSFDKLWIPPISNNPALSSASIRAELQKSIEVVILDWQIKHTINYLARDNADQERDKSIAATVEVYQNKLQEMKAREDVTMQSLESLVRPGKYSATSKTKKPRNRKPTQPKPVDTIDADQRQQESGMDRVVDLIPWDASEGNNISNNVATSSVNESGIPTAELLSNELQADKIDSLPDINDNQSRISTVCRKFNSVMLAIYKFN